jgi:sortase A
MRRWGFVFIFIGICVFAFPKLQQWYQDAEQQKLLASLNEYSGERDAASSEPIPFIPQNLSMNANPQVGATGTPIKTDVDQIAGAQPSQGQLSSKQKPKAGTMGIVEIPKIKVKLPILAGASSSNLKLGAAHLTGTAKLGERGNAVIAAHHSYTYGRMFNRLEEVSKGDTVHIQSGTQTLIYKVTGTEMVEPKDTSVLKQPAEGQYLTLITCDNDGSHRFIVHAKLEK